MINAQYYTDFLYRPRRPEELDTAQGGGVVFSQGAHQVDIVRLLGGGRVAQRARADRRLGPGAARPKVRTRRCSRSTTARSRRSPTAATRISTATSSAAGSARWARRRTPSAVRCGAPAAAARRESPARRPRSSTPQLRRRGLSAAPARRGRRRVARAFRRRARLLRARRSAPAADRRDDLRRRRAAPRCAAASRRCRAPKSSTSSTRRSSHGRAAAARRALGDGHARGVPRDSALGARAARDRAATPGRRVDDDAGQKPRRTGASASRDDDTQAHAAALARGGARRPPRAPGQGRDPRASIARCRRGSPTHESRSATGRSCASCGSRRADAARAEPRGGRDGADDVRRAQGDGSAAATSCGASSAGNRRKVHIFLTAKGKALKRKLVPLAEEVNAPCAASLRVSVARRPAEPADAANAGSVGSSDESRRATPARMSSA